MTNETCEGFTNYATFSVAVVVDNERGSQAHAVAFVQELKALGRDQWEIAAALKDYHESAMPELDGYWSSLLRSGFEDVDWLELTEHWDE